MQKEGPKRFQAYTFVHVMHLWERIDTELDWCDTLSNARNQTKDPRSQDTDILSKVLASTNLAIFLTYIAR